MLRTIQSNIVDLHTRVELFTEASLRSVTVFAMGSPDSVGEAATSDRLRLRAAELINGPVHEESSISFSGIDSGAVEPGQPFGVAIDGYENHLVRSADGPLPEEAIAAVRIIGLHNWV